MIQETWTGKQIGSYEILSLIGKGGAGRVYKARHVMLEREAAVKVLRTDLDIDEEYHKRFLQEANTIANMRHPHVVQLYDFGMVEETYYMVMEYIRGDSLETHLNAARVAGRQLPGAQAWRIIKQMSEGLTYIHERGVVHRDIKPANILLTQDGNAVISDFGVAKLLAGRGNTTTGAITGTPVYMAPEQALGYAIDHRADLYCLAIIVYEMLTGRVPFEGPSPVAVILKHLNEPVPPPRQLNPAVPPKVEKELLKALSKRRENRHQSILEFFNALAGAGPAIDSPPEPTQQVETVVGPDGKEYIHIPAGEFVMGTPFSSDAPRRKVYLDGFYISRYPVTNAEYHAFIKATRHLPPEHWRDGVYTAWEADHPVVYVNWEDAIAYCRWAGGRLPSEAEWEKASRGTDERRYPWGKTFDPNRCNTREGKRNATSPVGKYSPIGDSPYGVGDMAGNVWEWVLDWHAPDANTPDPDASTLRNPLGPETGRAKVIRGGSFNNNASLVTCFTRDHAPSTVCAVNYGFRVRLTEELFELLAESQKVND